MKRADVSAALNSRGCRILRDTGNHTIWICPCGQHRAPLPRLKETSAGVVRSISRPDGLPAGGMAPVTVYAATATREGDWWVVIVPDVGATQVRRLSQASMMAADMVAAMLDVPRDTVAVAVTARVSREVDAKVKRARIAVKRASQAQRDAAACSRQVARELLESGLTGADAAEVLGVSPQRISQLVKADG